MALLRVAGALTEAPDAADQRPRRRGGRSRGRRPLPLPTAVLLLGAVYCLLPVAWVLIAATKNTAQLFNTFTFAPDGSLGSNIASLSSYAGGVFWHWMINSVIYAVGGATLSTLVSAMAGYALAKYEFRGRSALFNMLLAGVLVPPVVLAVPQYLLLAKVGLTDTYWSVLLPSVQSPYGIYLARIYAMAAVPDEVIDSARVDGCREGPLFARIAVPMMVPGQVTVNLFQFVARLEQLPAAVHHAQRREQVPDHRRALHAAQPRLDRAVPVQPGRHRVDAVDPPADHRVPGAAAILADRHRLRSGQAVSNWQ